MKKYLLSAGAVLIALTALTQNQQAPETNENDDWYLNSYTTVGEMLNNPGSDPGATDKEITDRLASMETLIEMPYNEEVKKYIEDYTKKGRKKVIALQGNALYYIPIFQQALEERQMPLELKYLPIVESELNANAVSKTGASGLWQFTINTANSMGMNVTSLVDERRDPYKSTEAACTYLKQLCDRFNGDWSLAIAAYNCGPTTVDEALAVAGGDPKSHDFWSIYNYLPETTRVYVPKFIAATYVMTYYEKHGFKKVLNTKPLTTYIVPIKDQVHLEQISEVLDIPLDELRFLNPQFRYDIIPAQGVKAKPYNLILPTQQVQAYILNRNEILNYKKEEYAQRLTVQPGGDPSKAVVQEVVKEEIVETPAPVSQPQQQTVASAENNQTSAYVPRRRRTDAQPSSTVAKSTPVATPTPAAKTNTPAPTAQTAQSQTAPTTSPTKKTTKKDTATEVAANQPPKNKNVKQNNTTPAPAPAANTTKKSGKNTATANDKNDKDNKKGGKQTASNDTKNTKNDKNTKKEEPKKAAPAPKPAAPKDHTVSSGENLTVIAKKNGTTVEALKKANPQLKGKEDMIHPGDKVKIPKKQPAPAKETKPAASKAGDSKAKDNKKDTKKKK